MQPVPSPGCTSIKPPRLASDYAHKVVDHAVHYVNGRIHTSPTCGRSDISYLATQRKFQCKSAHAKRQFSVKVGTIFEDSPLGLEKWLPAVWIITSAKDN
jgi:hypothetical protein